MSRDENEKGRSITSEVDVPIGPEDAFHAFTEELDLWWVRGPINHFDSGRTLAMVCEPGVGGRLLEVYDESRDDVLELARITAWEPGRRLCWQSSIDDVETEVRFEPSGSATTVRVVARIPAAGSDRGGTAWTRVVPKWFGPWCARRDEVHHGIEDIGRLALAVGYERPAFAARWLARVFGFETPDPLPEGEDPLPEGEHGHPWIEFRIGNGSLMVFKLAEPPRGGVATHVAWVYVDDIEEHYERAEREGATILQKLDAPWGLPMYVAADPEGHRWTFARARPTM